MDELVRSGSYVALYLPSLTYKIVQILPNITISLGKFGSFETNDLIGRPFYLTYEIRDGATTKGLSRLRVVSAAELHEHVRDTDLASSGEATPREGGTVTEYEVLAPDGEVVLRSNVDIMDDPSSQKLTTDEIELLKQQETASGRDVVAKIMASHTALDKKNEFSLAKYTLRKTRKFLRRFTPLPLDTTMLAHITLHGREPMRTLEIREEILALLCSWSNVHCGYATNDSNIPEEANRWLTVDETGGLVVAAMAERMGMLNPPAPIPEGQADAVLELDETTEPGKPMHPRAAAETKYMSAKHNTITLIHANAQPNISILSFFSYNPTAPDPTHPLHAHLKTLTWLQLLHPEEDALYMEPPEMTAAELAAIKPGRRSAYYRKRRRWQRMKGVIDETRDGGFAGLVVASCMEPWGMLNHAVPLLRGGAQVAVYSASIEPLVALQDYYSTARRNAFLQLTEEEREAKQGGEDFPVDPCLLLATAVHTVRARPWQVLPGRTHPVMTDKGGAEGYIFVGTRVLPTEGATARGKDRRKRRKAEDTVYSTGSD